MWGPELNAAIAHGLSNAAKLLDKVAAEKADYHFIEIMACPWRVPEVRSADPDF